MTSPRIARAVRRALLSAAVGKQDLCLPFSLTKMFSSTLSLGSEPLMARVAENLRAQVYDPTWSAFERRWSEEDLDAEGLP